MGPRCSTYPPVVPTWRGQGPASSRPKRSRCALHRRRSRRQDRLGRTGWMRAASSRRRTRSERTAGFPRARRWGCRCQWEGSVCVSAAHPDASFATVPSGEPSSLGFPTRGPRSTRSQRSRCRTDQTVAPAALKREALTSPAPTSVRMLSIVNENTRLLPRGADRLARAALVREDVRRGGQSQVAECHRDSRKGRGHPVPIGT
jgi:hypothetical protein